MSGQRFEDCFRLPISRIVYEISHADVLKNDTLPFVEFWDVNRIARAGGLRRMFNKVDFCFSGFDHDSRGIYAIPEIRKYVQKLTKEWPYFYWASTLDSGFLWTLVQAMVPTIEIASSDKSPEKDLTRALTTDLNAACLQLAQGFVVVSRLDADITKDFFDGRLESIHKYFQNYIVHKK